MVVNMEMVLILFKIQNYLRSHCDKQFVCYAGVFVLIYLVMILMYNWVFDDQQKGLTR